MLIKHLKTNYFVLSSCSVYFTINNLLPVSSCIPSPTKNLDRNWYHKHKLNYPWLQITLWKYLIKQKQQILKILKSLHMLSLYHLIESERFIISNGLLSFISTLVSSLHNYKTWQKNKKQSIENREKEYYAMKKQKV